jgi:hypothetical protein
MKIIVNSKEEAKALRRVLKGYDSLLSSMPSYRGDFIQPRNVFEYILMWKAFSPTISVGETPLLTHQYAELALEWEEDSF